MKRESLQNTNLETVNRLGRSLPSSKGYSSLQKGSAAQTTIIVMVVLVLLLTGLFFVLQMGSKKNSEKVSDLLKQSSDPTISSISVDGDELELLLELVESPSQDQETVYQTLSLASAKDKTDVEKEIAEVATKDNLSSEVRVRLFQILKERKGSSALPLLVDYFSNAQDERSVVASIQAAQPILTDDKVIDLFKLISFADSVEVQTAAEGAVKEFANANLETTRIGPELAKAYKAAKNPAAKRAYLRLLGSTGGHSSKEVIEEAISSKENSIRISAYKSLQDWPDSSMFPVMFEALAGESDREMQDYAFNAVVHFFTQDKEMKDKVLLRYWKELVDETEDDKQKAKLIQSLGQRKARWTIPILQFYLEDDSDDITYLSEMELEKIEGNH